MKRHRLSFAALLGSILIGGSPRLPGGDLEVIQVAYGDPAEGNVLQLSWIQLTRGPARILIDGALLEEIPGLSPEVPVPLAVRRTARNVAPGRHDIMVEDAESGDDLGSQVQTVLEDHGDLFGDVDPASVACEQVEEDGDCKIIVDWMNPGPAPNFHQVFLDGERVLDVAGFERTAVLPGALPGQRCAGVAAAFESNLEGQEGRYRGEIVEACCTITCGAPPCQAPQDLLLCQTAHGPGGEDNTITARWKLPEGPYAAGIQRHINGAPAGLLPGDATRGAFERLPASVYEIGIEGDCGEPDGRSTITKERIRLLTATPHPNPVAGAVSCSWTPLDGGTTAASWTPGEPSDFIDVHTEGAGGNSGTVTIDGDSITVSVRGTLPADAIVLQFFVTVDGHCHGSLPLRCAPPGVPGNRFLRGLCNPTNRSVDISSAIWGLNYLFVGGPAPACIEACDGNRDGSVNIADMVYILGYLFQGGPPPPGWVDADSDGRADPTCETAPAEKCGSASDACEG